MKGICDKLCDPDFSALRTLRSTDNDDEDEQVGVNSYIARSPVDPVFGQVFSPMLSEKTGFGRFLSDISYVSVLPASTIVIVIFMCLMQFFEILHVTDQGIANTSKKKSR